MNNMKLHKRENSWLYNTLNKGALHESKYENLMPSQMNLVYQDCQSTPQLNQTEIINKDDHVYDKKIQQLQQNRNNFLKKIKEQQISIDNQTIQNQRIKQKNKDLKKKLIKIKQDQDKIIDQNDKKQKKSEYLEIDTKNIQSQIQDKIQDCDSQKQQNEDLKIKLQNLKEKNEKIISQLKKLEQTEIDNQGNIDAQKNKNEILQNGLQEVKNKQISFEKTKIELQENIKCNLYYSELENQIKSHKQSIIQMKNQYRNVKQDQEQEKKQQKLQIKQFQQELTNIKDQIMNPETLESILEKKHEFLQDLTQEFETLFQSQFHYESTQQQIDLLLESEVFFKQSIQNVRLLQEINLDVVYVDRR